MRQVAICQTHLNKEQKMSVFVILIGFALFLTYKPLFKVLKVSKLKFESIKLELAKQETKKEFNDFALKQANLLTNVVLKIVDLIADFFGKKSKNQPKEDSSSATQNSNNANAQSNAQDEQTPQQQSQQNTTNAESSPDTTKK